MKLADLDLHCFQREYNSALIWWKKKTNSKSKDVSDFISIHIMSCTSANNKDKSLAC